MGVTVIDVVVFYCAVLDNELIRNKNMKLVLNEKEVREALEQFVRKNYLREYDSFTVEVLDIMDVDGITLELGQQITVEMGVCKTVIGAAPCPTAAPIAPTVSMPAF